MFGIRKGKVFRVNYSTNTVDILMDSGFGVLRQVPVAFPIASTNTGCFELPVLKTINNIKGGVVSSVDGNVEYIDNLFHLENTTPSRIDLEDSTNNYVYGLVVGVDEMYGKSTPVCIGFITPKRNQVLFDPDNVDTTLPEYVQEAIKKLKGALLHRTNSDVYWLVDSDGNFEWSHPNGTFFRIAETPTEEVDGVVHVDLSGGNSLAKIDGNSSNLQWNTTFKTGLDGEKNASRKLYAHMEVVTEQGTVEIDINKKTGNVVIKTPKNSTDATSADTNQVTIICGGNATLESVAGDIKVQSVQGEVVVEASTQINQFTDSAADGSILLGFNGGNGIYHLAFLERLIDKFNNHRHTCNHTGQMSSPPDKQLDNSDGTSVTKAG